MPVLLALDLSQQTGWACGSPDGPEQVRYGTMVLDAGGSRHPGAYPASLIAGVSDLLKMFQPDQIITEAPLPMQAQTHANTARRQYALADAVDLLAYMKEIPVTEARVNDVRQTVIGRSNFGGRAFAKEAVMTWAARMGYQPKDDNAADALTLLHYGWAKLLRRTGLLPSERRPLID